MPLVLEANDEKNRKIQFYVGEDWFPLLIKSIKIIKNKEAFIVKLKKNEKGKVEIEKW
jgi:hypothetical protein